MSEWVLVLLILGCCICVLALPVIPQGLLLGGLLVTRSLSDVGAASTGSLLPSSAISTALGALAILIALLPSEHRLSDRKVRSMLVIGAVLLVSTGVSIMRFGSIVGAISEPIRILSLMAVFILGYRYAMSFSKRALRLLGLVSLPSALLLIAGLIINVPSLTSSGGRAVGTFSHPNTAAAFFSLTALISIGVAVSKRSKVWLIVGIVNCIALLLTQSLGGLLGFIVGGVVLILLRSTITPVRKLIIIMAVGSVVAAVFAYSEISARLEELNGININSSLASGNSNNSLEWRIINWKEYLEVFATVPFLGTGSGSTYGEIMPLGGPPHSLFVQFLVEYGLVGAGIFLVLSLSVVAFLARHISDTWVAGLMLSVLALMAVNGSESNLFGYTAAMYYVAAAFGVLWVFLEKASNKKAIDAGSDMEVSMAYK